MSETMTATTTNTSTVQTIYDAFARGAVATLAYAYADGVVVIDDLAAEAHPMVHDLCGVHAGGLRVPVGWELRDRRSTAASSMSDHDPAMAQLDLIGA